MKHNAKKKNYNGIYKMLIMHGFELHYWIGCLIMLIWMVLYIILWHPPNIIWSSGIIFKKIAISLTNILPFPPITRRIGNLVKRGTSFVKGKEMTNYQIPYNKIGKILYRLFCIIIHEL